MAAPDVEPTSPVAPAVPPARPAATTLQAALPKEMYVDEAHWLVERDRVLFTEEQILAGLARVASEVTDHYRGTEFTVVSVLKGSCVFASDLIRRIPIPLELAREAYLAAGENTAFGHFISNHEPQIAAAARRGLNRLVASFGPALIDRAALDALCRALGISFYQALRRNVPAIEPAEDLAGFDMDEFLAGLRPRQSIAARHTVGLADPITQAEKSVADGLPESLEEVVQSYRPRWFKLKVGGDAAGWGA